MTDQEPKISSVLQEQLTSLYSAPAPRAGYAQRLRSQLIKQARADQARRAGRFRFVFNLSPALRVVSAGAVVALLLLLLYLGATLAPKLGSRLPAVRPAVAPTGSPLPTALTATSTATATATAAPSPTAGLSQLAPNTSLVIGILGSAWEGVQEHLLINSVPLEHTSPFPTSSDTAMIYQIEVPASPMTAEEAEAAAARLGVQGRAEARTGEGGEPTFEVSDGKNGITVYSIAPLHFVYGPVAQEAYQNIPLLANEERAALAEAFLREHGLLDPQYRLASTYLAAWQDRSVDLQQWIDDHLLLEPDPKNPRTQYNLTAAGSAPHLIYESIPVRPIAPTPIRSAEDVWSDIQSGKVKALLRMESEPDAQAPLPANGTVDSAEIAYYAVSLRGTDLSTLPEDSPTRIVMPLWRFSGKFSDGRAFAIYAEAAADAKPVEAPPRVTPGTSILPAQTLAPQVCAGQVTPPAPRSADQPSSPDRPRKVLGGGIMQSGDFKLELWLYCDSAFTPNAERPEQRSDFQGLGLQTGWRYSGPEIQGQTTEIFGLSPFTLGNNTLAPSLTPGSGGLHPAGIQFPPGIFPDWSENEFRLRFVQMIITPGGQRIGAALSFRLVRGADGFTVDSIQTQLLTLEKLSAVISADPLTVSSPLPVPTLDPAAVHPLLGELYALRQHGQASLYPSGAPPAWVHMRTHITQSESSGALPKEYDDDQWFQLGENNQVLAAVIRQMGSDGAMLLSNTYQDGIWRSPGMPDIPAPYAAMPPPADQHFYANAAGSVKLFDSTLTKIAYNTDGLQGDLYTLESAFTREEILFDLHTGKSLMYNFWQKDAQGSWKLTTNQRIQRFERVPEAPADVLALLGR